MLISGMKGTCDKCFVFPPTLTKLILWWQKNIANYRRMYYVILISLELHTFCISTTELE